MICNGCGISRNEEDFLGKEVCYSCQYKQKKMAVKKNHYCRVCEKELDNKRWVFCSEECAKEGKKKQDRNYWVHKITINKIYW